MPSRTVPAPRPTSSRALEQIGPLTPHLFCPTPQRPVRAKAHGLRADVHVTPHSHPWAQLTFSVTGVLRLSTERSTYIVPPTRAVWVPAGVEHAITVVEDADMRTVYFHQPPGHCGPDLRESDPAAWQHCRVLEVSELLRALVLELDTRPDGSGPALTDEQAYREHHLSALVCDELRRAREVPLGVNLPTDKRLRALCEAVLHHPTRHTTLEAWARDVGASPRTLARLFRQELNTSFVQWRQQVLLAKAVSLAARRLPMSHIASELGYASPSAFTAMVRRSVGTPPSQFFGSQSPRQVP
ncbi:helix-turn-helix transcriptional regulator [Caldimonas thermodepolymerans]|jgi:AraC-type DNA-binding domain-containing proteins|uniref:AraC family transcriptional regulator n=1 Tax=Caldimonas thermodepolymerans TaxID=215580 RepID=A0A2S5T1Y0_9BURK|nr:helix-turn-helix transcriptional regulator [Caldimonas thermodepolymerans]PPE68952.1 AraC family transcriptional regulator [Caldimonas thermodepolymerans]QPC30075.1 helix-turn-helix transcriptional regulator [Caldimonas thermodepolymerans]RDI00449.1 AraC-like DNA-binding protein [Caldimonas thermodepolymerans]UZG42827.1 helix-turn-helix transcriptional regulator [Caldimonas thermodepolymerans]